jgi:hypothetical protein
MTYFLPADTPVAVGRDREMIRYLSRYGKANGLPFPYTSAMFMSPLGAAKAQSFAMEFGRPLGGGVGDGLALYESIQKYLKIKIVEEFEHPSCDYVCLEKGFFFEANQYGCEKPIPYKDIASFELLKKGTFLPIRAKTLDGAIQINFKKSKLKDIVIKSNQPAIKQLKKILEACGV